MLKSKGKKIGTSWQTLSLSGLSVSLLRKLEISMDRTSYLNQVLAQISILTSSNLCPLLCWVLLVFHLHWRLADALVIMGVVG